MAFTYSEKPFAYFSFVRFDQRAKILARLAEADEAGRDPGLRWKAGQRFGCASRRSAVPGRGFCDRSEHDRAGHPGADGTGSALACLSFGVCGRVAAGGLFGGGGRCIDRAHVRWNARSGWPRPPSRKAFTKAEMIPAAYQMSYTADRDVETIRDTSRTAPQPPVRPRRR